MKKLMLALICATLLVAAPFSYDNAQAQLPHPQAVLTNTTVVSSISSCEITLLKSLLVSDAYICVANTWNASSWSGKSYPDGSGPGIYVWTYTINASFKQVWNFVWHPQNDSPATVENSSGVITTEYRYGTSVTSYDLCYAVAYAGQNVIFFNIDSRALFNRIDMPTTIQIDPFGTPLGYLQPETGVFLRHVHVGSANTLAYLANYPTVKYACAWAD